MKSIGDQLTHLVPQRIATPVDSRSCTPSQQTTSFGMGDDDDEINGVIINDDYLSSSENSGQPQLRFFFFVCKKNDGVVTDAMA